MHHGTMGQVQFHHVLSPARSWLSRCVLPFVFGVFAVAVLLLLRWCFCCRCCPAVVFWVLVGLCSKVVVKVVSRLSVASGYLYFIFFGS